MVVAGCRVGAVGGERGACMWPLPPLPRATIACCFSMASHTCSSVGCWWVWHPTNYWPPVSSPWNHTCSGKVVQGSGWWWGQLHVNAPWSASQCLCSPQRGTCVARRGLPPWPCSCKAAAQGGGSMSLPTCTYPLETFQVPLGVRVPLIGSPCPKSSIAKWNSAR